MAGPPTRERAPRSDAHNASIDPFLAAAGRCGMTHLPSGRVCDKPARHAGSCQFDRREKAYASMLLEPVAVGLE